MNPGNYPNKNDHTSTMQLLPMLKNINLEIIEQVGLQAMFVSVIHIEIVEFLYETNERNHSPIVNMPYTFNLYSRHSIIGALSKRGNKRDTLNILCM